MVSERCGDSDFDPVSDEEDDSDGDEEEDLEASASENSCSSASQEFVFGSFGGSVSTTAPSPWIAPTVDGFTIKIGAVPCSLIDSRNSNRNSAIDASEENQKIQSLDSELIFLPNQRIRTIANLSSMFLKPRSSNRSISSSILLSHALDLFTVFAASPENRNQ